MHDYHIKRRRNARKINRPKWELSDVVSLFKIFNKKYFNGVIKSVILKLSENMMGTVLGLCWPPNDKDKDPIVISLNRRLLRGRSRSDLINVLLVSDFSE